MNKLIVAVAVGLYAVILHKKVKQHTEKIIHDKAIFMAQMQGNH